MSTLLITPVLANYDFFNDLCNEASTLLSITPTDEKSRQDLKTSIFLNFNRYLMGRILFLPEEEAEQILASLVPAMKDEDESRTLQILDAGLGLMEIRNDFLNIIKNIKK